MLEFEYVKSSTINRYGTSPEQKIHFEYDSFLNLVKLYIDENNDGQIDKTVSREYNYNDYGQIKSYTMSYDFTTSTYTTQYTYHDNGQIETITTETSVEKYDKIGNILSKETTYDQNYSENTIYEYNNIGNLVNTTYYLNGFKNSITVFSYNENGLKINQTYSYKNEPMIDNYETYSTYYYYEDNRLSKEDLYQNSMSLDFPYSTTTYNYDKEGNLFFSSEALYYYGINNATSYTYDNYGNEKSMEHYENGTFSFGHYFDWIPLPPVTIIPTNGLILYGNIKNDILTGGIAIDTIILSGLPSQYRFNGSTLTGIEGTDTLSSIEQFRFGSLYVSNLDATALTDPDGEGPADSPAKDMLQGISDLYVAYFNRAPDVDGLMYWFREVMDGSTWTLPTIAQSFTDQAEYRATYPPGLSNREFINTIYQNLFDRAPDTAGLDWWEKDLDRGVPRDVFIYAVIQGAYAPSGSASDKALLNNKHDVSLYYSEQLATSIEAFDKTSIDQLLNRVTADAQTVGKAEAVIDYVIENPITLTGLINDTPAAWEAFWV